MFEARSKRENMMEASRVASALQVEFMAASFVVGHYLASKSKRGKSVTMDKIYPRKAIEESVAGIMESSESRDQTKESPQRKQGPTNKKSGSNIDALKIFLRK